MPRRGITKQVLCFDCADERPTNGSKTSLPVSTAAAQRPPAVPVLGQRLGIFPGNTPHRGNPRGNSLRQTAKVRDNSRPAPASNSPIPQNLCRNLKRNLHRKLRQRPTSYSVGKNENLSTAVNRLFLWTSPTKNYILR